VRTCHRPGYVGNPFSVIVVCPAVSSKTRRREPHYRQRSPRIARTTAPARPDGAFLPRQVTATPVLSQLRPPRRPSWLSAGRLACDEAIVAWPPPVGGGGRSRRLGRPRRLRHTARADRARPAVAAPHSPLLQRPASPDALPPATASPSSPRFLAITSRAPHPIVVLDRSRPASPTRRFGPVLRAKNVRLSLEVSATRPNASSGAKAREAPRKLDEGFGISRVAGPLSQSAPRADQPPVNPGPTFREPQERFGLRSSAGPPAVLRRSLRRTSSRGLLQIAYRSMS